MSRKDFSGFNSFIMFHPQLFCWHGRYVHVDGSTYEGECGTPAHLGGQSMRTNLAMFWCSGRVWLEKACFNCFLSPGREFHRMFFFSFCRGLHLLHCQITCTNDQKYFPEISIFYNIACESAWVSRKPPKGLTFRWAQVGARRKVGQRCRVLGRWSQACPPMKPSAS